MSISSEIAREKRARSLFELLPGVSKNTWDDYPEHFKEIYRKLCEQQTYYHKPTKTYYSWDENNEAYRLD